KVFFLQTAGSRTGAEALTSSTRRASASIVSADCSLMASKAWLIVRCMPTEFRIMVRADEEARRQSSKRFATLSLARNTRSERMAAPCGTTYMAGGQKALRHLKIRWDAGLEVANFFGLQTLLALGYLELHTLPFGKT